MVVLSQLVRRTAKKGLLRVGSGRENGRKSASKAAKSCHFCTYSSAISPDIPARSRRTVSLEKLCFGTRPRNVTVHRREGLGRFRYGCKESSKEFAAQNRHGLANQDDAVALDPHAYHATPA